MSSIDVQTEATMDKHTAPKRLCPLKNLVLLDVFSEIITDSSDDIPTTTTEVEKFFSEPLVDYKTGDLYAWWGQHNREFPLLYKLAQRYLNVQATSVPSEQLFSAVSNLHNDKWNRILPSLTEYLLFIQNNFCVVGSQYNYS